MPIFGGVRPVNFAGLFLESAKNPRYVGAKNEARKNELPGLFLFEPSFTSALYGGEVDRMSRWETTTVN